MSRTSPLRRVFSAFAVLAMMVVGTLAADRATAHAAMAAVHATQPPCHRLHQADGLALTPVNACDTVCAGSAPESSYDAVPARFDLAAPAVTLVAVLLPPPPREPDSPALRYGHGPPPQPAYLRDRRLLI